MKHIKVFCMAILAVFTSYTVQAQYETEQGLFGGALTGAVIGGVAGGGKGAAIGAASGAVLGGMIGSSAENRSRRPVVVNGYYDNDGNYYEESDVEYPEEEVYIQDRPIRRR
jgi:outer membrane lipoprotein SlyB